MIGGVSDKIIKYLYKDGVHQFDYDYGDTLGMKRKHKKGKHGSKSES